MCIESCKGTIYKKYLFQILFQYNIYKINIKIVVYDSLVAFFLQSAIFWCII